ncbi:hypothetical protein DES45_1225 [Microvirga subterranea]|uniref:Uncharacterized protein n=1 Tax=Microvirga subterranea TaxID=186651 RepID=A0A370H812_9HYPH|nr:hypothetical protein DES45_1225 [Microvirga subterranea]
MPLLCSKIGLWSTSGYTIRISQTEFEWMAFITAPGKRPSITLGPDRDSVVAKACQWIEAQPRIEKQRR